MIKRQKASENFYIDELVDPVTYFTEIDFGVGLFDPCIIDCLQLLRILDGKPMNVNGWWKHLPKDMNNFDPKKFLDEMIDKKVPVWSGFRSKLCDIGAPKSAHKTGQAVDPKGDEKKLYKLVKDNAKLFYDFGLRRLEDIRITNGWLHMDTSMANHVEGRIRIIDRTSHVGDIIVN